MVPKVSVVLPAYNGSKYIGDAVESIISQTFGDFELIVINDGSTDETLDIVQRFTDRRISIHSQANIGLAGTLNRGLGLARGEYIARQDQDDWSFPERLAKQVAFLEAHPACALLGTWAEIWRDARQAGRTHAHPADDTDLKFLLLLDNPFVHSSIMLRRTALDRVGGYSTDPGRQPPEDYELWSRIAREFDVANLPEVLHVYREVERSMSRQGPSPFADHLVTICAENVAWAAGVAPSDPRVVNLAALQHGVPQRMLGEPDFRAMRPVFRAAAARVTGHESSRFDAEAERRIDDLEDRWGDRRSGGGWRRRLNRAARRVSRALR